MKKKFVFLAATALAFFVAMGDDTIKVTTVDGIEWHYVVSGETATVFGGKELKWDDEYNENRWSYTPAIPQDTSGEIVVPSELDTYKVTAIGDGAFTECKNLKRVVIQNGVTSIGEDVFSDCVSLQYVRIPEGVVSIGGDAFDDCESLEAVWLPSSLESIGSHAFSGCRSLSYLLIPQHVSSFGAKAFSRCTGLQKVIFPASAVAASHVGTEDYIFSKCDGVSIRLYHVIFLDANDGEVEGTYEGFDEGCWPGFNGDQVGYLPDATRAGDFVFDGWWTAREGGARVTPQTTMVDSDITLYAHWREPNMGERLSKLRRSIGCEGAKIALAGDAPWTTTERSRVRSGKIGEGETSILEMTVKGPGVLYYNWLVENGQNADVLLSVSVDGEEKANIDGEHEWHSYELENLNIAGDGEHVVRWSYSKTAGNPEVDDFGALTYVYWSGDSLTATLRLDPNGGKVSDGVVTNAVGMRFAEFISGKNIAWKDGYGLLGWFTERTGGRKIDMYNDTVESDATFYAQWETVILGSCEGGAQLLQMGSGLQSGQFSLVPEWGADYGYDDDWGVYYCKFSLPPGVYTVAAPCFDDDDECLEAWGGDKWVECDYGWDGNFEYYLIDTTGKNENADVYVLLYGENVGELRTLFWTPGNFLPRGTFGNPVELPGGLPADGSDFEASGEFMPVGNSYYFSVDMEPGISYGFTASGQRGISVNAQPGRGASYCDPIFIDKRSSEGDSASLVCHVTSRMNVLIGVHAERGEAFNAVAHWWEIAEPGTPVTVAFDANGSWDEIEDGAYTTGSPYGNLPSASYYGHLFLGWFTEREGGQLITPDMEASLRVTTLYAHWEALVAGSCLETAILFPFGPSVAAYPVTLTRAWRDDERRYDEESGVLYCKALITQGKVYTLALPVGQEFEVSCCDPSAVVEYASDGTLRYCRVDARNMAEPTEKVELTIMGAVGARTTVYAVEGNLVPAGAEYEDPGAGGLPGSCLGKATAFEFGPSVAAKSVRLVREWDGVGYRDGGAHYLTATAPASGRLTVALPASQADGCTVSCAGTDVPREDFNGIAFWIFDANEGDVVTVKLSGTRGADAAVYTYGGDFLAKKLIFNPNGGTCAEESREVRAGAPIGKLPDAKLDGSAFLGWFTVPEGGARVTPETAMVNFDVTLYAHWEPVAAGSCREKAIPFPFGPSVAAYPVTLAKEWLAGEERYNESSGVLYCKSSVVRGKMYTLALPAGQKFTVSCEDAGAIVEYATSGALRLCLVDARDLSEETAELDLALSGEAGSGTIVYAVEGNLVPAGADYEDPDPGNLPGSCPSKAMSLEFAADGARARTVRLVREWDEGESRLRDGSVRYLQATAPVEGRLTVAVSALQAEGCTVTCAGAAASREDFSGLAFWIFDAREGDEVVVKLAGTRGADVTVYTVGWDYLAKQLVFNPNGGSCAEESRKVRTGSPVGKLPEPDARDGHVFLGWFTAPEGGARVTAETVMVGFDVTLYAHWEKLAAGSSQEAAVPFAMTASLAAYPVPLAREWLEEELKYSDIDGTFYCKTTLARDKVYTMAVPKGLKVKAWCVNGEATTATGSDASLQYVRFDTTNMAADETEAYFAVFGDVGQSTTIYAVEGDFMPKE